MNLIQNRFKMKKKIKSQNAESAYRKLLMSRFG